MMPRTVSEIRAVEQRLRATADQMLKAREIASRVGGYTESRFSRAWACLQEAADCMSYITGHVEMLIPAEEREPVMQAILAAMGGVEP